jgi:4-hydroxythreonine-4-phosphate dehydrogenase
LRDCPKEVTVLERLVVADDLSGAAESAATFLLRTTRITVHLASDGFELPGRAAEASRVVVLDSDTRHAAPAVAGDLVARYAAQLVGASRTTRVVKKVDSLLRGNLAAEVGALAAVLDAVPVVATALPSSGRTLVGGVPLVDGSPLATTTLWDAEDGPVPARVADVLTGLDHVLVPLDVVRDPVRLRAALVAAEAAGRAAVCDAETDADLDAVVAATTALRHPLLVGSAALVAADARQLPSDPAPDPVRPITGRHVVVAVVGSAAPGIAEQVAALAELGLSVVTLDPRRLLESPQEATGLVAEALTTTGLALTLDQTATVDPGSARRLAAALAAVAAPATARATVLLATGGETARAVLDSLGVRTLTPLSTHASAVTSHTPDGLVVVTRPGSHGASASSLRDALAPFVTTTGHAHTDVPQTDTPQTDAPTDSPRAGSPADPQQTHLH